MVEFAFAEIGSVMVLISTFHLAMPMWHYHTLATWFMRRHDMPRCEASPARNRANTCSITVGNVTRKIESTGIGIPANRITVKFTTESGAEISCAPVASWFSNASMRPPASKSRQPMRQVDYDFR